MSARWRSTGWPGAESSTTTGESPMISKQDDFPNLRDGQWRTISPVDPAYNCIAFAAGRTDVYWWPDQYPDPDSNYWPAGITRAETLDAVVELFAHLGYSEAVDASLEAGYEKVAIYADGTVPTHAAGQLPDGRWKSKLGTEDDIEHDTLEALVGPCYGTVARIMKRRLDSPSSMTTAPPDTKQLPAP